MQRKTQFEQLMESPEFRKLYAVEGLVAEAGEFIARLMRERKVTKAELARRLGKSRAYITQMLSGSTNLTIRTLAEVAFALGAEVKLEAVPLEAAERQEVQAETEHTIWKVIEMPSSPVRSRFEGSPRPGPVEPGDHAELRYHYVA